MKIINSAGQIYVRHWLKWYWLVGTNMHQLHKYNLEEDE